MDPFSFASSAALVTPVSVRVGNLEGEQTPIPFSTLINRPDLKHVGSNISPHSDLYVTVQLWADSKPLTVPLQTAYKSFKNDRKWNEWLTLPIRYSDLPLSAQLAITIWDLSPAGGPGASGHAVPFGGTTIGLFDKDNTLQKGRQKCHVHRRKAADGLANPSTPSEWSPQGRSSMNGNTGSTVGLEEERDRMEKLLKKHEMGEIPRIDWLDNLVFRGSEKRHISAPTTHPKARRPSVPFSLDGTEDKSSKSDEKDEVPDIEKFTLYIELPRFDFPVVYADHEYPTPPISSFQQLASSLSSSIPKPPPEVILGPGIEGIDMDDEGWGGPLIKVYDAEVGARENPAETKHRRLVRSHRTGIMDRDLRPNAHVRDELNGIMNYSPTHHLTPEEKDLVWKFRHHLSRDKRALTKFVKSVNWQDPSESKQAVEILPKWTEIDVDDALELLGPTFDNPAVRAYAVDRLRKSSDDELLLYLLQLVQALKFEHILPELSPDATQDSSLARFLISRATNNFLLGNYFHWYLMVECDDKGEHRSSRKLFAKVEYDFMTALVAQPNGDATRRALLRQAELIIVLSKISGDIKNSRESMARKEDRVKQFLVDPKNELVKIEPPIPLPLDPTVLITGLYPDQAKVFKSSLSPICLSFKTATNEKYTIIFKTGDDLRQDQLVIQIITLMDQLLRKENLDLKLSPYKILATGATAGAVEFVESKSLATISYKYGNNSVLQFLKANNPDKNAPLGVRRETLDTFVKSCAGYCVITYLLGVGDRHLDNLLLAADGRFFHIDFGFILGRDPKPFPPAMKLCKEMVDGMGGASSEHYQSFKEYCFTAYTTLRKSSNLILNLFSLMIDANITDIQLEPDKAVLKVKDRFHLEMTEEESIRMFERLIEDSSSAIFPAVIDRIHGMVQHWRP